MHTNVRSFSLFLKYVSLILTYHHYNEQNRLKQTFQIQVLHRPHKAERLLDRYYDYCGNDTKQNIVVEMLQRWYCRSGPIFVLYTILEHPPPYYRTYCYYYAPHPYA